MQARNKQLAILLLLAQPSLWISPAWASDTDELEAVQTLIVAPRATLELSPPEDGGRVEAAINGGALAPVSGDVEAPPTSGNHWLAVLFRDGSGNHSPLEWIQLRVDGIAPELQWRVTPEPYLDAEGRSWVPKSAIANLSATDDVAGISELGIVTESERKAGEQSDEVSLELHASSTGAKSIVFSASDKVGNRAQREFDLHFDVEAPSGELSVVGEQIATDHADDTGNTIVVNGQAKVVANISDGGSGLKEWSPTLDGQPVTPDVWEGPWSEGFHTIAANASDWVGNDSTIGPLRLSVDTTAPELDWRAESASTVERDGEKYHRSPVQIFAEATDTIAGVQRLEWSPDGKQWSDWAGPIQRHDHRVEFRTVDRVGNVTRKTAAWNIDDHPPVLRLRKSDGTEYESGSEISLDQDEAVDAIVEDGGSGVAGLYYVYPRVPVNYPHRFTFRSRGRLLFRLVAVDALGNLSRAEWVLLVGLHERAEQRGGVQ